MQLPAVLAPRVRETSHVAILNLLAWVQHVYHSDPRVPPRGPPPGGASERDVARLVIRQWVVPGRYARWCDRLRGSAGDRLRPSLTATQHEMEETGAAFNDVAWVTIAYAEAVCAGRRASTDGASQMTDAVSAMHQLRRMLAWWCIDRSGTVQIGQVLAAVGRACIAYGSTGMAVYAMPAPVMPEEPDAKAAPVSAADEEAPARLRLRQLRANESRKRVRAFADASLAGRTGDAIDLLDRSRRRLEWAPNVAAALAGRLHHALAVEHRVLRSPWSRTRGFNGASAECLADMRTRVRTTLRGVVMASTFADRVREFVARLAAAPYARDHEARRSGGARRGVTWNDALMGAFDAVDSVDVLHDLARAGRDDAPLPPSPSALDKLVESASDAMRWATLVRSFAQFDFVETAMVCPSAVYDGRAVWLWREPPAAQRPGSYPSIMYLQCAWYLVTNGQGERWFSVQDTFLDALAAWVCECERRVKAGEPLCLQTGRNVGPAIMSIVAASTHRDEDASSDQHPTDSWQGSLEALVGASRRMPGLEGG